MKGFASFTHLHLQYHQNPNENNQQHPDFDCVDLRGLQQHPLLLQHHRAHVRLLRFRHYHHLTCLDSIAVSVFADIFIELTARSK